MSTGRLQGKPSNMASSIASDLLAAINHTPYKQIIPSLPPGSGTSEDLFPKTSLAKKFKLNVSRWVDSSFMNPNAMFKFFGVFSNQISKQVHCSMIWYMVLMKKNGWKNSNILKNSWITLHMMDSNSEKWSKDMKSQDTPGDKIALYVLC